MKLFIDGREYPAHCGEGFSLSYNEAQTRNIESMRSGMRVGITVPSTPDTDRLFADAALPHAAKRFADEVHNAVVTDGGLELVRGVIRLKHAVKRGDKTVCYRAEILTGAPLWVKNAARTMIHDTPVKYDRPLTPADICSGWTDDVPVKFFPVHRDSYELSNSSVSLLPPEKIMMTDDYHPFISVEAVVRGIFDGAGYDIRSRFMESEEFRSLYMSGVYASTDVAARKRSMDFLAGRLEDATAEADYSGRVYASASVAAHTVGNIADTVVESVNDGEGGLRPTGFFSKNDCFTVVKGVAAFTPLTSVKVGFEYDIAYVTDYVIESRTRLRGFDTIYLGNGVHVPFTLANRFKDYRSEPRASYSYKLVIFGDTAGRRFRLTGIIGGQSVTLAETSEAVCSVVTPAGAAPSNLYLYVNVGGTYSIAANDWALYAGHVEYRGRTEVEITLRTPAEELTSQSVRRFNDIFFEGADPGMKLTLLKRTTLKPVFTAKPAYGSQVRFADVARYGVRQTVLLEALQQMFNLRFLTDESTRTVFIEPCDDFYGDGTADWSDKADLDTATIVSDPSADVHEVRTLAYRDGEGAVLRWENDHGESFADWSLKAQSWATLEGPQTLSNPLFAPTLNAARRFDNAEDALIMEVCDRDDGSSDDNTFFTPRIVRYTGMQPLPQGQRWGYPFSQAAYPLAAFHLAEEHGTAQPFTLCFNDRDGVPGLKRYHLRRMVQQERGPRIKVRIHMTPADAAGIFACSPSGPSVRSLFRLRTQGQSFLCTLEAVEGYNPAQGYATCTFLKTESLNT